MDAERERRVEARIRREMLSIECWAWGNGRAFHNVAVALLDVSTVGARLRLAEPVAAGERLSILFKHARTEVTVCMPAEVRWVAPDTDAGCVAGASFRSTTAELLPLLIKG
jgi:hypothetical protein